MGNKTTKTVKVDQSKAEQWDEYVAENAEVDSVSHLIRLAVQKEISGAYDVENRKESRSDDVSAGASGEVLTHLRKIETAIDDVESRVSAIEGVKSAEANYDIEKATFNTLPEPPEGKGIDTAQETPPDFATTVDEIARKLGAEPSDIEDALTHLRETTGQIRRVTGGPDNKTYYWRKGR
jgi:hypothetical protein